ncbi:PREDICTED: uncharacterized protein LOC105127635 isoform X3 [Populus euphratica]|uniref:Uncharacterized protein LOC105127635 isoform X3 n=1 Tax=Populus euphratica TaxID=75702 RepID=A0AAJ6UDM1_POPEU|nr:PREDICTED: uncharacterized protein LOC105127635 isoform X3 [Populus euphratica]
MGNEMGNNNTSGLREEDSTTDEAQEKSVQAPSNANVVKEENHEVPAGESKDNHEKVTGLDCDDRKGSGDTHDHNQTSDEAEHAEAHPTPESPKAETKPNEVGDGDNEFHPASFLNELEGDEKSTESDLEETVLGANSNQLERQASFKKATEEQEIMSVSTFVTISPSHDPEPQESMDLKFDQQEFIENHSEQSVKDSTNSLETSENILGSNVVEDIITKENGHLVETCASDNLDEILVSGTTLNMEKKMGDLSEKEMAPQEDKMLSEEKVDVEVGNEVGNDLSKSIVMESTTRRSDTQSEHRCEEEFTREMDCYGNNCSESQPEVNLLANSPNCHTELSVPEDKCMVLTEETEFTRKDSETEVNKHHYGPNQLMDDSNRVSDIDLEHASQTDSFPGPSFKNNEESSVDASHDPASNGSCQVEEAKVAENGNHIDLFNDIQSEASEDGCKESEGNTMIVPELGIVPEELSMSNWKSNEGETDCKLEEEKTAEKQIVEEIREKTEAPFAIEKGGQEQQSGEQLVSKTLAVQAEAYNPQAPASLFQSQDQQQEKVTLSGDTQGSNELTLELKPESCEEFLVAKVSTDQAEVMTILETSASAVELAMDKPQEEVSSYFIAAREVVRETKSLAFDQCEKLDSTIFPKGGYEAQESVGRLSTGSNPDNLNIHAQMRKSPSFDLDLRIEARSEESDQTPLLYQDKTTVESLSDQSDVSLQSPHLLSQCSHETLRALSVEENVIALERSDSEKSRTPFLGFLKEDEEAHAVVTPKKQDNHAAAKKTTKDLWNSPTKEVASASPKGKEKHKRRTSLFGQCMCCATVIN